MKTMSYSESRKRYAEVLDSVVDDREEVVITRAGHEPAVIVSLDDWQCGLRNWLGNTWLGGYWHPHRQRHGLIF